MKKLFLLSLLSASLLIVSCETTRDTIFENSEQDKYTQDPTPIITVKKESEKPEEKPSANKAKPEEEKTEIVETVKEEPKEYFTYTEDSITSLKELTASVPVYQDNLIEPVKSATLKGYEKTYLHDYAESDTYELPKVKSTKIDPELLNDLNTVDKNGCTSLMRAVRSGNDWKIKALIDAGAMVNATDNDGWTALMYAVRYQSNLQVIKMLIDNGANIRAINRFGTNALFLACCYNDNPEIIATLLKEYTPAEKDVQKAFILVLTTQQPSEFTLLEKLKKFIEIGTPLNTYYEGKTPLMYAAQFTQTTKVLKLLLDYGAKPKARSTEGKTVFEYASENKTLPHDDVFWSLNKK